MEKEGEIMNMIPITRKDKDDLQELKKEVETVNYPRLKAGASSSE